MTSSVALSGLGKSAIEPSNSVLNYNPYVRVKRQDTTTEVVKLMEEHGNLLKRDFPKFSTEFCQLPPRFEFETSRLKGIEGFPSLMDTAKAGTTNPEREWKKVGTGFAGEEKLFKMLTNTFSGTQEV